MDGTIMITYRVLCDSDFHADILVSELLANEKIAKVIKSEYAKGLRNLSLLAKEDATLTLETTKKLYTLEVAKDDFADLLSLAEEDANNKKLLKKECSRVELVDITTN